MPLLTAAELTAIQDLAEMGMDDTGTIWRKTKVTTSEGTAETYAQVGSSDGWLVESSVSAVVEVGGVQAAVAVFEWRVPVGTDIRPGDQVAVDGAFFNVTDTDAEGTILPYVTCKVRRAMP